LSRISQAARDLYASQIERKGPAYRNAADAIRSGGTPTLWVEPALQAIDQALRFGPQEADDRPDSPD
jgi:hypothetical protein